ncbi:MAG: FAD-dependent monooxygenase [Acidobacteria bacterium]|uniref:FAD-dependent monooxygenase n=1 Tax=Candidatus Polarisedimenticola svalbardensis TaxID=2886004 RepID=A0A8J6Y862_9BACT|nr:FAD-dependent monooxygenase [Candidatus Polarisedimenticola svalbardensis]
MSTDRDHQVLVVGAGPVGLMTALCLAERGVKVRILEKEWRPTLHSFALALHPESLRTLEEFGLAHDLTKMGRKLEKVAFYEAGDRLGEIDYAALHSAHPYLLVLPQSTLETALEEKLRHHKVQVEWNHQALAFHQDSQGVQVEIAELEKVSLGYPIARSEWAIRRKSTVNVDYVVAADGYRSMTRQSLGIRYADYGHAQTFFVFEFPYAGEMPAEMRIVLGKGHTSVFWPIEGGRGRWSFEVDMSETETPGIDQFRKLLKERAPWFSPAPESIYWSTLIRFDRRLAVNCGEGRVWLAGDAVHATGPVGIQSMNVGLREAGLIARNLASSLQGGGEGGLAGYESSCRTEWHELLGVEGGPTADAQAPSWVQKDPGRIIPCIPGSGEDLGRLLSQIGMQYKPRAASSS